MNLMTASDVIVLGIVKSVEAVTSYTVTKYAPETLISIIAIIVFGIAPGLGGIIGTGDLEKAAKLRGEIMSLTWLIVTTLGASVILWNRAFITLWVGAKQYAGDLATLMVVLVVTQFILIRNDSNVIDLTLNLKKKVVWGLIAVTISLVGSIGMMYYLQWGIFGLCLGLIFGRLIMSIGYPIMVGRFLKIPLSEQLKGALRPAVVMMLLYGVNVRLSSILNVSAWHGLTGWTFFALSCAVTFFVVLTLAFYAGLNAGQRGLIFRRIRVALSLSAK
jgi:O-antigen/teichoic acid export membrane protein